jgi:hypothetical protein
LLFPFGNELLYKGLNVLVVGSIKKQLFHEESSRLMRVHQEIWIFEDLLAVLKLISPLDSTVVTVQNFDLILLIIIVLEHIQKGKVLVSVIVDLMVHFIYTDCDGQ